MPLHPILYEKKPYRLPRAGTPAGEAARNAFVADVLALPGETRRFFLPKSTDTTTSTDVSRAAATITHAATIAGRMTNLGSGLAVSFNGTSDYSSYPDAAALTFGDGSVDEPFHVITLFKPTALSGNQEICGKFDVTTGATQREWRTFCSGASFFAQMHDDSAGTRLGRSSSSNLVDGTWVLMTTIYTGSGLVAGLSTYKQATQWDDTDASSGTYVAMENKTSVVYLGASKGTAAVINYFVGSMALNIIKAGLPSTDDLWRLTNLCNGFFGLTLS